MALFENGLKIPENTSGKTDFRQIHSLSCQCSPEGQPLSHQVVQETLSNLLLSVTYHL